MIFGAFFRDFHGGAFAERPLHLDLSTLQQFQRLYPLPEHLQRAVLKRQVEFLAGRVCAQHAIATLTGQKPDTIPSQPSRAPAWPRGIVGSITHTTGYVAALVAQASHYQGLGIDCEVILSPDKLNLQTHICVPNELDALQRTHPSWSPETLLTLIFSAKESLFKCLYPQVQTFFGFSAARVTAVDPTQHTFNIQLEHDLTSTLKQHTQWPGQVRRHQHLLLTAITVPAEPSPLR